MFDSTDDNPYRSPALEVDEKSLPDDKPVGPSGTWRWRHYLIVQRREAVLPRACVRSNASGNLAECPVLAIATWGLWLVFLAYQVPAIGLLLVMGIVARMMACGYAWEIRVPMRRFTKMLCIVSELAIIGVLIAGNGLSAFGLYRGSYFVALLGFTLSLLAYAAFWASDRCYLRTHIIDPDYISIQRVHPEYLNRLPEFHDTANEQLFTLP